MYRSLVVLQLVVICCRVGEAQVWSARACVRSSPLQYKDDRGIMGCGASSLPPWQAEVTADWPRYSLIRTQHGHGMHSIEVHSPDGRVLLSMNVFPYKNRHGHVSVVSIHPFSVEFVNNIETGLSYEQSGKKTRTLSSAALGDVGTYKRQVSKRRTASNADTTWRAPKRSGAAETQAVACGVITLPAEISVVNANHRVAVWRGSRPSDAQDAYERGSRDLLAQVLNAGRGTLSSDGCTQVFELTIRPELADAATAAGPAVISLFLAIATEGFWSQGSVNHASGDEVAIPAPSIAHGQDVRDNKNLIDSIHATANQMK